MAPRLDWDTLVQERPGLARDVPPGTESLAWVANTVALISGEHDAVLVDTFLTLEQTRRLVAWIDAHGKRLTTVYITHGHGDHFFGLRIVLAHFPDAHAVATREVVERMRKQLASPTFTASWRSRFPGQLADTVPLPTELRDDAFELEGQRLIAIPLGHTDTLDSTCLHVPSLGLVVAGDVVYDGIHPYLGESTHESRLEWIEALDTIDALHPNIVIPGHGVPHGDDSPRHVAETRAYLLDFDRLADETSTARDLYDRMLALYPRLANPGSLWRSATAAKA
jgi:glyoxylase-like metal-dependent hydrolase (beta-lactamase superfamily II)